MSSYSDFALNDTSLSLSRIRSLFSLLFTILMSLDISTLPDVWIDAFYRGYTWFLAWSWGLSWSFYTHCINQSLNRMDTVKGNDNGMASLCLVSAVFSHNQCGLYQAVDTVLGRQCKLNLFGTISPFSCDYPTRQRSCFEVSFFYLLCYSDTYHDDQYYPGSVGGVNRWQLRVSTYFQTCRSPWELRVSHSHVSRPHAKEDIRLAYKHGWTSKV